jgi:hypothetical protein
MTTSLREPSLASLSACFEIHAEALPATARALPGDERP